MIPPATAKSRMLLVFPLHEIVFVSDVTRELDAAREAGMQTTAMRPSWKSRRNLRTLIA